MFWAFLLVSALAFALVQLGAASVMVSMLSMALQGAVFVIATLAVVLLWKKLMKPKGQPTK